MKAGQTLLDNGVQVALFTMEYLRITQGRYGTFSHSGYNAYDIAGKDGGRDKWYAPFDIYVEWVDRTSKTGVVVSNNSRVLLANGKIQEPKTIKIMLWHDNDNSPLKVGQIFKQGEYFYLEGTGGYAFGNHIHMELAYGKYDGGYPLFKLSNGYWTLKGTELNIEDAFFVNDTVIMDTCGYNFKTFTPSMKHTHEPEVWSFTANTRINIREYHSTSDKIVGKLEKGQTYDYIEKYNDGKHVWISNGKTWVAVREVKNGVRQETWGKLHAPNTTPQEDLFEGKFKKGQYILLSTLYKSHHEDQIIEQGKIKGYIIHIYPKDKYPLAISDTKGGKQIGATKPVNVYHILG